MNGSIDNPCESARLLVDRQLDEGANMLSSDETARLEAHLKECRACLQRQAQMREIIDVAKAAPQFDVSEALTQRILASVDQEKSGRASAVQVACMFGLLAAGTGLFVMDSVESLYGIGSWCVGLAAMVLIKSAIGDAPPRTHVGR